MDPVSAPPSPSAAGRSADSERIAAAVREILDALGLQGGSEGLAGTPQRVARMYAELFSGVGQDAAAPLRTTFAQRGSGPVLFSSIPFYSICEHHLLPFFGTAQIAYLPDGRITGLSKVVRALKVLCARPQVQERLTAELADLLQDALGAQGSAVALEARHLCMEMRGVRSPGGSVVTTALRGSFERDPAAFTRLLDAAAAAKRADV